MNDENIAAPLIFIASELFFGKTIACSSLNEKIGIKIESTLKTISNTAKFSGEKLRVNIGETKNGNACAKPVPATKDKRALLPLEKIKFFKDLNKFCNLDFVLLYYFWILKQRKLNFRYLYSYLKKNIIWVSLFYLIGVSAIMGMFLFVNSNKKPVYPFEFSFELQKLSQNQGHVIASDLKKLFLAIDTLELANRLNLPTNVVSSITFFDFNLNVYERIHTAEIKVETTKKENISPIYEAFVNYFNSNKFLVAEIAFKKEILSNMLNTIQKNEKTFNASESNNWELISGKSTNEKPIITAHLTSVYLAEKKAEVLVDLKLLNGIKVLNEPIMPLYAKKPNKIVYFVFSNIIVLSLIFVRILIAHNLE